MAESLAGRWRAWLWRLFRKGQKSLRETKRPRWTSNHRGIAMPQSVWKGFISFGLISVPIRLYAVARYSHIAFHEIHRECGTRVRQQLYCPYDKRVVSRDEIVMGYEVAEDKYVLVDPV